VTTVARDLPIHWSVLRLKGDAEDEIRDEPLPEPSDLITGEGVLPEDQGEEDDGDEARGLLLPLPGPLIAAATFVPTFLAVFFGLSYLLGDATQTAHTASAPMRSAIMSDLGAPGTPPLVENATPPSVEPSAPPPAPTLPPVQPRTATLPAAEPRAPQRVEPPRQPQAAVLTTAPEPPTTAEARKSGRDWTPAAAFADREAAGRLASSIQQQGYPVEIRQEQSSARPWVVWIGAQPRGGERRR
jgi:hypothetical protein